MAQAKTFTIKKTRYSFRGKSETTSSGTLEELIAAHSYTLECGASYAHEKGNKQINLKPSTIKGLVSNLNKAVNNSAANGCSSSSYEIVEA